MRISVLASGSKGNAVFVEIDGTRLLLDVGIGIRRLTRELAALDVPLESLDAVCITHEHTDHVKGLPALLRAHQLPVYSRPRTLAALPKYRELPLACLRTFSAPFTVGALSVEPFATSHDAADPVGYTVRGTRTCTLATDLGFVTNAVQTALEDADVLIIEANHDPAMLKKGSYPWPLKQRILGTRGHLANLDTGWALSRIKRRPAEVFLAHLSEENNRPAVARETVENLLLSQNIPRDAMALRVCSQADRVDSTF